MHYLFLNGSLVKYRWALLTFAFSLGFDHCLPITLRLRYLTTHQPEPHCSLLFAIICPIPFTQAVLYMLSLR